MSRVSELKVYDTGYDGVTASSGAVGQVDPATVLCISAPAQGTGPNERVGKKIIIL